MSTTMTDIADRQEREVRAATHPKKTWEPEIAGFLTTTVVGAGLGYATVLVIGAAAGATGIALVGWIVLGVFLGSNALFCGVTAVNSLLHFV